MLKITDLHAYYGSIEALKGINLEVAEGKITCLIGSNGAGKTTLLKSISGCVDCKGSIKYGEEAELIGMSPQKVARQSITHVPEGRLIFPGLSVYENLEVGTITWHGFFGRKPYDVEIEEVFSLFPRLREREKQLGWSLSGGEQQMLAIGRALMSRPKVLMLDEPSMGLAPLIIAELFEKIIEINKLGITILLVEQNARLAMRVSDYTYVIDQGNINIHGPSAEVRENPNVIKTYLGKFAKSKF
ncbi:MAG: ABC transporter ATP-binding protein [Oscillospiraceae bacterium]|nr:ABC transporter ATP-binding protein [Oscillospiraceae bacterium]